AERPGAVVSKDTLIKSAWPGQAVEESNLTVQIAALRRVLSTAPGGDRWIETMSRRGYRFIGPLLAEEEDEVLAAPALSLGAGGSEPTHPDDAERRQIPALSCELVGAAARADGMDLENLRAAAGAFQRCVSDIVARRGGLVVSGLGNTVVVLFGYPLSQEH